MIKFYRFSYILLILAVSLNASCDSPHSNPFDPENPEGHYSKLEGYAKSITPPYLSLSGVRVSLGGSSNMSTLTNSSGYFSFFNIDRTSGRLIFQKDGYLTDTLALEWNGKRELLMECFLKRLPVTDSFFVYSIVENHYDNTRLYKLVLKAFVNDFGSNDIDTVSVICHELGIREKLPYNPEARDYERIINYKKQEDIEKFIGKTITLSVKNRTGDVYTIGSNSLKRIIPAGVFFESPANNEQTDSAPVFKWLRPLPGFNFTYSIQVFTNTIPAQLAAEANYIPPDSLSYTFQEPFQPGEYFWFISCTDEFKNAGQSTPASFMVK